MGRHVVGWVSALRSPPDPGGDSVLQFSEDSPTREGEDKNYRENQVSISDRERTVQGTEEGEA